MPGGNLFNIDFSVYIEKRFFSHFLYDIVLSYPRKRDKSKTGLDSALKNVDID
jgi:hypothetical protein